jgi:hypothetical protein
MTDGRLCRATAKDASVQGRRVRITSPGSSGWTIPIARAQIDRHLAARADCRLCDSAAVAGARRMQSRRARPHALGSGRERQRGGAGADDCSDRRVVGHGRFLSAAADEAEQAPMSPGRSLSLPDCRSTSRGRPSRRRRGLAPADFCNARRMQPSGAADEMTPHRLLRQ